MLSKSGNEREVFKYLPFRKSNRGVQPKMGSAGMKAELGSEKVQWVFPNKNPPEIIMKEMMGMVAEIAILILWRNYSYKFGGKIYLQRRGGPIGQRPTMAAARLVMNEFMENYREKLVEAKLNVTLLKVYVDDGRQVTSKLRKGMRYCREKREYVWSREAEEEDLEREKKGEDKGSFMARLCLPLMNDINPDLTFTAEVEKDFPNGKLPTLDTELWM